MVKNTMNTKVLIISGHMIDSNYRETPRFPVEKVDVVRSQIRGSIQRYVNKGMKLVAVGSGTCGCDLIFHQEVLDAGGEVILVLPYKEQDFIESAVESSFRGGWLKIYNEVKERVKKVVVLGDDCPHDNAIVSEYCNRVITGIANLEAIKHGAERPRLLAVWDGNPGDAPGGTQSMIDYCQKYGIEIEILDSLSAVSNIKPVNVSEETNTSINEKIVPLIFVDVVGFSKLKEDHVKAFIERYLAGVAKLLEVYRSSILFQNSWGDGLFVAFTDIAECVQFSIRLRDFVKKERWENYGLPNFDIRLGLHIGPVYEFDDPILHGKNYLGPHVNMAARIEPSATAGKVTCSYPFAAIVAMEIPGVYSQQDLGVLGLDKSYGSANLFEINYDLT